MDGNFGRGLHVEGNAHFFGSNVPVNCDVVQDVEQQLANYHSLDCASLASRRYTTKGSFPRFNLLY